MRAVQEPSDSDSGHLDTAPDQGLRERKRIETRLALETAALDLALEVGVANLTVEQIAERANVSRRTFFNYFASKEDALVGEAGERPNTDLLVPHEVDEAFDLLTTLRAAIHAFASVKGGSGTLLAKRMRVFATNPHLIHDQVARASDSLETYASALSAMLAGRLGTEPSATTDSHARLLLMICAAVLHHATDSYLRSPETGSLSDAIDASFAALGETKELYS